MILRLKAGLTPKSPESFQLTDEHGEPVDLDIYEVDISLKADHMSRATIKVDIDHTDVVFDATVTWTDPRNGKTYRLEPVD